jgi:hypothetical protein
MKAADGVRRGLVICLVRDDKVVCRFVGDDETGALLRVAFIP